MRLSMLNDVRNKIEVNRILIELINKLCTIKGNYWNNFSENYLLINNINENYYCYFCADWLDSGNFKILL